MTNGCIQQIISDSNCIGEALNLSLQRSGRIRGGDFGCPSLANVLLMGSPSCLAPQETIPEELGKPVSSSGCALGINSSSCPAGTLRKKPAEVIRFIKKELQISDIASLWLAQPCRKSNICSCAGWLLSPLKCMWGCNKALWGFKIKFAMRADPQGDPKPSVPLADPTERLPFSHLGGRRCCRHCSKRAPSPPRVLCSPKSLNREKPKPQISPALFPGSLEGLPGRKESQGTPGNPPYGFPHHPGLCHIPSSWQKAAFCLPT